MLNFCTLFDSNYIHYGLALYESLNQQCKKFHLYIFAFDDKCYDYFSSINLVHATIIKLETFEDADLLKIKHTRTKGEYCWTCTPSIILFAIEKYKLDSCIFVDADIYFFSDPTVLIEEMGDKSVLITEHRYTPSYNLSSASGIYCVQFMVFKNDMKGKKVLHWWRDRCIEWCYARHEDGKFGDQKYLDDWLTRFEGVHSLNNLGGGVAPWNIEQYNFKNENSGIRGIELSSNNKFDLIFYHFHNLKLYKNKITILTSESYGITPINYEVIYQPYVQKIIKYASILANENIIECPGYKSETPLFSYFFYILANLRNLVRKIKTNKLNKKFLISNFIISNKQF